MDRMKYFTCLIKYLARAFVGKEAERDPKETIVSVC